MKLVEKCPICNSGNLNLRKKLTFVNPSEKSKKGRLRRLFTHILRNKEKYSFFINFCERCGYLFLNPRFSEEEYRILFRSDNAIHSDSDLIKKNLKRALSNYNLLKKFSNFYSKDKLKVLDYGGSSGYMLIPFLKNFDCYLIDYVKYHLPKEITYLGRSSNDLQKNIKFDIIFLQHVLEHVNDPKNLIEDLVENLNENGILHIQVPLGCLREWKSLDTPLRHINFFSEQSLFYCIRMVGLKAIHLNTTYEIFQGKFRWIINVIGKKTSENSERGIRFLTTNQQKRFSLFYYMPYLLWNRKFKPKIIKDKLIQLLKRKFKN